ncbi:MAG: sugar kinase [Planctomycetes bacterium]|nr:sugar kinase [Planctomycetota bacterium]
MSEPLPDFSHYEVAVVGDLVADRYVHAEPARVSREAPVLVLRWTGEELRPGGAANAARNLRALGARVRVLGCVGRDAVGRELLEVLEREQLDVSGIESLPGWTTPTKTRVLAAEPRRTPQQVFRIDREPVGPLPGPGAERLAIRLRELLGKVDAVLLSDYDYGAIGADCAQTLQVLRRGPIPIVLDPRHSLELMPGLLAATPNLEELAWAAHCDPRRLADPAELARVANALRERLGHRHLLVTQGNRGMTLFGVDQPALGLHVEPCGSEAVVDVSGAGDTAAAAFLLALTARCAAPQAMRIANAAAGVVVMKSGTAVCDRAELTAALAAAPAPREVLVHS